MTDILPPIKGKNIDKAIGKDAVAIITDECLFALIPYRMNGVDNCINLRVVSNDVCCDVHPKMKEDEIDRCIDVLADECDDHPITMPMCSRDRDRAWSVSADIFDALAAACRGQISRPNPQASAAAKPSDV
jgi:hypothetical protein